MNKTRTLLFRAGAIVLLLAIAGVMMVIGRGHTVYMDSRTMEYEGKTYETPYKVVVTVDGEQVAKLYDKERGMATCIGQSFSMTLEITQEKGGSEEVVTVDLKLPYGMDGIAINLPAYLAGLPEEVFLSEFQPAPAVVEEDDVDVEGDLEGDILGDEFGIGGDI